jgi:hypothetical protein
MDYGLKTSWTFLNWPKKMSGSKDSFSVKVNHAIHENERKLELGLVQLPESGGTDSAQYSTVAL